MSFPVITRIEDPLADVAVDREQRVDARRAWIAERLRAGGRGRPLRALISSNTLGAGGAEHQILRLIPHLTDLGLEIEHFYYAEPHHLLPRFRERGIRSYFLERARLGQLGFWKAGVALMRRRRYDIVHAFSESANFYARALAVLAGVPVIIGGWRARRMWPARRHRIAFSLLNLATAAWVINAKTNAEGLSRLWGMHGLRTYVVPNALDLDPVGDFVPAPLEPETAKWVNGRMIVGAVGRIALAKNFDMFLDVAKSVCEKRSDVCFCVAGGLQQKLRECEDLDCHLRRRVERENLGGVVRFLGRLDNVAGFLPNLAVALCTSDYEGCPNAVIEAMRAGRPVVMTDCADTEPLIEEGVSGHVVPLRDTRAMVRRTLELLDDPDRRRRFGKRARELVEQHFDAPNSAWVLARIYVEEWARKRCQDRC